MGVKWHWHRLRHTFASNLLQQGLPLPVIKEVLGHASITTSEIYAGLNRESVRNAFFSLESGPQSGPKGLDARGTNAVSYYAANSDPVGASLFGDRS